MKVAHHKVSKEIVTYKLGKDFLGTRQYQITFSNGERSTLSISRFNELFNIGKPEASIKNGGHQNGHL